jgi:hypothetical protein
MSSYEIGDVSKSISDISEWVSNKVGRAFGKAAIPVILVLAPGCTLDTMGTAASNGSSNFDAGHDSSKGGFSGYDASNEVGGASGTGGSSGLGGSAGKSGTGGAAGTGGTLDAGNEAETGLGGNGGTGGINDAGSEDSSGDEAETSLGGSGGTGGTLDAGDEGETSLGGSGGTGGINDAGSEDAVLQDVVGDEAEVGPVCDPNAPDSVTVDAVSPKFKAELLENDGATINQAFTTPDGVPYASVPYCATNIKNGPGVYTVFAVEKDLISTSQCFTLKHTKQYKTPVGWTFVCIDKNLATVTQSDIKTAVMGGGYAANGNPNANPLTLCVDNVTCAAKPTVIMIGFVQ